MAPRALSFRRNASARFRPNGDVLNRGVRNSSDVASGASATCEGLWRLVEWQGPDVVTDDGGSSRAVTESHVQATRVEPP